MINNEFGHITGKDARQETPVQQIARLGNTGETIIAFPYGLYCDLPQDFMVKLISESKWGLPVTQTRPNDTDRAEPVFFHPETNTRIIPRNDGSLDIETGNGGTAPVNIKCTQANIVASDSVTIDTPETTITGNLTIQGNNQVDGNCNVGGNATLGDGGTQKPIARQGDTVANGIITGGSTKHTAN